MIFGIGTDIVEIKRFEKDGQVNRALAKRVLTQNEHKLFDAHTRPVNYLAKRFAVKEAIVKAFGTGIGNGVGWQQIDINNAENGKPTATLNGFLKEKADRLHVSNIHISISDEADYATAFAVIEVA